MFRTGQSAAELWAVLDSDSRVLYTPGGSSTRSRLMVYPSEKKAEMGLKRTYPNKIGLEIRRVHFGKGGQLGDDNESIF